LQKGERGIWQRRFWEHVNRDERDYERHADYIHYNPVKNGHVERAADWPYSGFHEYVKRGIYDLDRAADEQVRSLEMEYF
jgi:putative transposase